jgi:hypothetical protein
MTLAALTAQMAESQNLIATLMAWLGECPFEWPISSELSDLGATTPAFGSLFKYLRYDVLLEQKWLSEALTLTLDESRLKSYRRIDVPANIPHFYELGEKAAELQMRKEHLTAIAQ